MKGKFVKSAIALAAVGLMAFTPATFAHGWGRGGYYHGGGYGYHGGYYGRGHYDHSGRWIAGAIVAGTVGALVYNATQPRTVVVDRPVYYSRPATVVYDDGPVVTRRVTTTTTTYDDGYSTRYVRDDGY
ncbi:hypothetical protein [Luteibacter yeojuensis]|uniref:hypothetical protein n=1 Tax=Luteibacter sp. CQ10 TaxID=2805821 RepID=UPI001199DB6C